MPGSSAAGSAPARPPFNPQILAALLGPGIASRVATPCAADTGLFPEEARHIFHAVARRRAEFATARLCAREALADLGVAPCALVPNADRSPRWPEGIVGSITHVESACAVAVTRDARVAGLGLDLEVDAALPEDVTELICTPGERVWLAGAPAAARGRLARLLFSAKEALYKCQYASIRVPLDFTDVELQLDLAAASFTPTFRRPGLPDRLQRISGRFAQAPGHLLTVAVLPP